MNDPTLDPASRYASKQWVASRLGITLDRFNRKRDDLERDGFPLPDPIIKLWLKEAVDEWIDRRNNIRRASATVPTGNQKQGANLDVI